MENQYMNMETLKFMLYEVFHLEKLLKQERFLEHSKSTTDIYLDTIKDFSDREAYPIFREMDEKPAVYKNNSIEVHPFVKILCEKSEELALIGSTFDYDDGGLQLPAIVSSAAFFIMDCANNNITGYPGLTSGAAELILEFGSQDLKDKYVPNMLSGKWGGTMCLTEPQAGSSLSDTLTSAVPKDDGSYAITGQKIFISGGDHQYCPNFVHLVLARIKGAPAGIKGISLFVVPQKRLKGNEELEDNDVITAADFQKMGQRGYCTTHLIFGENENTKGWLLGEEHQGLKYMFLMMNGARIAVGRSGVSIATAAYHASLNYAKERVQGRKINNKGVKNPNEEPIKIIEHPDVRRLLTNQKAISEGTLSLVLQASLYWDLKITSKGEEKKNYDLLLGLLTPIVKAYSTEKAILSVSDGLQVLGGYGFCNDFILQQYYRDIRIMTLYEGTTAIQSLDLLARKISGNNQKALHLLGVEIKESMSEAHKYEELHPYIKQLEEKLTLNKAILKHLFTYALEGNYQAFLADSSLYMDFLGTIVIAWQWLKIATSAQKALSTNTLNNRPKSFYESKLYTMKFFFRYELAKTTGLAEILKNKELLTISESSEFIQ